MLPLRPGGVTVSRAASTRHRRRYRLAIFCLVACAGGLWAVDTPKPEPKATIPQPDASKAPAKSDIPSARGVEALKLPPGTVIVVPLEKYQDQLNQIENLKSQLRPDKPVTPAVCN